MKNKISIIIFLAISAGCNYKSKILVAPYWKENGAGTESVCDDLHSNRPYAKGDGSAGDPFLICNEEQFNEIGLNDSDWASHFLLGENINLGVYDISTYNVIGGVSCGAASFTGNFNGDGKKIINLSLAKVGNTIGVFGCFNGTLKEAIFENINLSAEEDVGVIGVLGITDGTTTAIIEDIEIKNSSFEGSYKVAPIAGSSRESTISNILISDITVSNGTGYGSDAALAVGYCEASTSLSSIEISASSASHIDYVGGIFGQAGDSCIITVFDISSATISGASEVGGVFGVAGGGYASNGSFNGSVSASVTNAGGLFGRSWWCDGVTFSNIQINGSISSDLFSGGAIGNLDDWVTCNIEKVESFATSTSSSGYSGGFIGRIGTTSNISNSAAFGASNGVFSGGFVGKFDNGVISTSYGTGSVSGTTTGGFTGEHTSGICTNCFFAESTNETTSQDPDSSLVLNSDISNSLSFTGWDFISTWEIRDNRPRIVIP